MSNGAELYKHSVTPSTLTVSFSFIDHICFAEGLTFNFYAFHLSTRLSRHVVALCLMFSLIVDDRWTVDNVDDRQFHFVNVTFNNININEWTKSIWGVDDDDDREEEDKRCEKSIECHWKCDAIET